MLSVITLNRLVFFFAIFGLLVSSFLAYEYNLGSITCPITGGGCDIVRLSPYSSFLGISLPYLGIVFYLFMMSTVVFRTVVTKINLFPIQLIASFSAVLFGTYLTYLEAFVIKAFCFWCILSFLSSILILTALILQLFRNNEDRS